MKALMRCWIKYYQSVATVGTAMAVVVVVTVLVCES